ncbi:MAG: S-layer homology domain-containing protein [Lachnospiraceae bacterium]|nr:S-layer homology domain-containing protein [Lachnospiraceae bacterium]
MKGSLLWKFMYVLCALTGILAGYGVFTLTGQKENSENTKDGTLVRETGDSVFFMEEKEETEPPKLTGVLEPEQVVSVTPSIAPVLHTPMPTTQPMQVTPKPIATAAPEKSDKSADSSEDSEEFMAEAPDVSEDRLPSLGMQWAATGEKVPEITIPEAAPTAQESRVAEAITYPAKIFGQTPVLNPSDEYVSYFEFCYDLVAMMEPEVEARGFNMNALMTKFALKALFCGVDIERLDINAPIPRRLAALCLWLAAQVLNESGCNTSQNSAENYVTDISSCSSPERKAIAYLYEQGVVKGYQVKGQRFYPQEGLKTKTGEAWLSGMKQCWK